MKSALCLAFALTVLASPAPAQPDLKGKTLKQTFDELLPKMDGQAAQQQWQGICLQLSAPGSETPRTEACKLMAEKLGKGTPAAVRIWLLKQLERIGRGESVEAVAAALDDTDEKVRDAAVRCLANNPATEAGGKLVAKLPAAAGKAKVGLINALGVRGDGSVVPAVAKELTDKEAAVGVAAARVLGKVGTPEAAAALAVARGKTAGEVKLAIGDAYLRCADRRLKEGKRANAAAIYKELNQPGEDRPIRLAALQGVLQAAGDQAGPMILELLAGTDADARAIAVGQIDGLDVAALKVLAASIDKLPATSQVLVLGAIAARGDKTQLPVALAAAKSKDAAVQRAGVQALGRLGDAEVVNDLVGLLGSGPLAATATDSLGELNAAGVDQKLIAALEAKPQVVLIAILERRKAVSATTALLKLARSDDAAVRAAAFTGLKALAEPKHAPEMVLALVKTEKGKEREQAELAIVAILAQVPEPAKRAEPVLALLNNGAKEHRAELLPLLGRLGGPDALKVIKDSLAASEPKLHEAAVAGLCNWPDGTVSDDLLKLIQAAKTPAARRPMLHALLRVNAFGGERSNDDKVASLNVVKKAMDRAADADERRFILEQVGFLRILDTFRWVLPYLDDKELNQAACKAVVELAHSRPLREPNKADFDKALDRVIGLCKDKTLVERAKQYKLGQ